MKHLVQKRAPLALVIACTIAATPPLRGQTTTTFTPSKDNTLYQANPGNVSNGQGNSLFVGRTDDSRIRRALLAFDLSSIPTNATITAATLTLECTKVGTNSAIDISLRRLSRDWGEGASDAPGEEGAGTGAVTGDATWTHAFFNTVPWSTAGGDFSGTASATTSVGVGGAYSWSGSGMVADIQAWVADPASNFGWVMMGGEGTDRTAKRFASREELGAPPRLQITYTVPGGSAPQLLNISTRMRVETGDNALIGGFIIGGNQPKRVILRAIGPSLTQRGVSDALADPVLELRAPDGSVMASNDDWRESQETEIQNSGVAPENGSEAAIVATLPAGNAGYTGVVRGKDDTTGVGLIEVYDLDRAADSRLANISTRGLVQTGSNVMIGGFIVGGDGNARVILRGIGPSLAQSGVANPLADPMLQLFDGNGNGIEANDNWRDDPDQAEIAAAGVAPQNDAESALLASIPPGAYTAIVAGQNSGTGVGLVEVYHLR